MLLGMKVRLLMSRQVIRVKVTDTVREAAKRMRDDGVSALPVMNGEDLVGILTERDLVDALIDRADPRSALVSAYMTPDPQYATPDDDSVDVALRMLDIGVRHLPVLEVGRVVGMVSARDLLPLDAGGGSPPGHERGPTVAGRPAM